MVCAEHMVCSTCKGELTPTPINSQYKVLLCMNVHCTKYASPQGNMVSFPTYGIAPPTKPQPATTSKTDTIKTELAGRPLCKECGRPFDAGLTKSGKPNKGETRCWICSNWSEEFRQNRQVYDKQGQPVYTIFPHGKDYHG